MKAGFVIVTRIKDSFNDHVEEFFLQSSHVQPLLSPANILYLQWFLQVKLL